MFLRVVPLALPLILLVGCARSSRSPSPNGLKPIPANLLAPAFPADDLNRPISLKAPAKRVVVIGPGAVETMFFLKAQSLLVGRDNFADFPAAAKKIAIGGDFNGPNIEQCLALSPDLVVVQGETSNRARFELWQKKLGVPVAALTTTNFQNLARDFRKLGAWIGKSKEAEVLARQFEAPARGGGATLRALIQTGDTPEYIAGRGTLVAAAAKRAGFANVADELEIDDYKQINIESLLVRQPDVLIVPSKKSRAQVLAALRANVASSKLDCVLKGRVFVVNDDLLLRPGPRLLRGVEQLRRQNSRK